MPIKPQSFTIYSTRGDRDGDSTTYYWFNNCGEFRNVDSHTEWEASMGIDSGAQTIREFKEQGFQRGVQVSNIDAVAQKISQFIEAKDADALEKLLKLKFIYPEMISSYQTDSNHSQGDYYDTARETYNVRPNIEALFVHHNTYFATMIDSLIAANNEALYAAFSRCLLNTDLANPDLFVWNDKVRVNILIQLNHLRDHGKLLSSEKDIAVQDKGKLAIKLSDDLAVKAIMRPVIEPQNTKARFENLKFKLQLVKELHDNDKVFNKHLGWKRFIANFCSGLFTLGVANYINYKMTGQALFFNKTTSQEKLLGAQGAIGFNPHETISFKR